MAAILLARTGDISKAEAIAKELEQRYPVHAIVQSYLAAVYPRSDQFGHTPSLKTGVKIASGSSTNPSAALSDQTANLYSDLLVHHMGKGLADGITQGAAGPDEFRTVPLWGVGQRVFFLHDGRTTNLVEAIRDHKSRGSEANKVIERFNRLTTQEQQEVIDFLRSL